MPSALLAEDQAIGFVDLNASASASEFPISEFRVGGRWSGNSNAAGFTGVQGDPITLTYGIIPDGTSISGGVGEPVSNSNLKATLNSIIPGGQPTWEPLIHSAYGRWGQVSGLTMTYEPNDDGATFVSSPGVNGVRADMRIGGHFIDGQGGSNTLAYNYFPNSGDHVVDTSNTTFYADSNNTYRGLRNVFMHEAGHGLGFNHFESSDTNGLMEPFINLSFDGPQHDDILAVQRNYGDALEKAGGNNTTGTATPLGALSPVAVSRGTAASDSTVFVAASAVDFVSIDGTSDQDIFSFSVTGGLSTVSLLLDPKGPTYNEGPQGGAQASFNTKALSDLQLQLLNSVGGVMFTSNLTTAGGLESIVQNLGNGSYFARVMTATGAVDNVQLYRLDLSAEPVPEPATMGMFAMAFAALVVVRRRRK